jgi:hypothetical protein
MKMETKERIELAEKIAAKIAQSRVWNGGDNVRIYKNGFAVVTQSGQVNIDACKGKFFDEIRVACDELGVEYGRTV